MVIGAGRLPQKPVFNYLAARGGIPARDMYNTFNMGAGMILAVDSGKADEIVAALRKNGENPVFVGACEKGEKGVDLSW